MKNKRIIFGGTCAIVVAILCAFGLIHYRIQLKLPFATVPDVLRKEARTGDILFSEGASLKSDLVRMASHCKTSNISHTGFLQQREAGLYVTHMSIDDGQIVSEPIDTFIRRNRVRHFYVMRLCEDFNRNKLSNVLDSLLLPPIGFDNNFDMEDNQYYYCTELIIKALRLAGCKALNKVPYHHILLPAELAQNKALEKIQLQYEPESLRTRSTCPEEVPLTRPINLRHASIKDKPVRLEEVPLPAGTRRQPAPESREKEERTPHSCHVQVTNRNNYFN